MNQKKEVKILSYRSVRNGQGNEVWGMASREDLESLLFHIIDLERQLAQLQKK